MSQGTVPPSVTPLTELDARELLAKPLLSACSEHGPTRVGLTIGCDEKTVRNARDEKSTLRLDFAANLLLLDGLALDPFLARVGRRSVPACARCDTDSDRGRERKVVRAMLAMSEALEGDDTITPEEVAANRAELEAAYAALGEVLATATKSATVLPLSSAGGAK